MHKAMLVNEIEEYEKSQQQQSLDHALLLKMMDGHYEKLKAEVQLHQLDESEVAIENQEAF